MFTYITFVRFLSLLYYIYTYILCYIYWMCAVVNIAAEYIVSAISVNRAVHSLSLTVIILFERLKLHKTFSENGSPRRTRHIFHSHIVVHVFTIYSLRPRPRAQLVNQKRNTTTTSDFDVSMICTI
jgi:hypothetical protein